MQSCRSCVAKSAAKEFLRPARRGKRPFDLKEGHLGNFHHLFPPPSLIVGKSLVSSLFLKQKSLGLFKDLF